MEPKDEQGRAQLHREAEAHEDAAEAARRADYAPQNHEDTRGDQGTRQVGAADLRGPSSGGLQPNMASQPLVPSALSTSLWRRAASRPLRWTITRSRIWLSPKPRNLNRRAAHVAANGLSPTYRQTERTSSCAGPLGSLAAAVDWYRAGAGR